MPDLEAALRLFPDYPEGLVWRGRALCEGNRCAPALRDFERAMRADPTYVWASVAAGACLEKSGRLEEARRHLERARELAPGLFERALA